MSRSRTKKDGTTKSGIRARRARSQRFARLSAFFRRFGKIAAVMILALWLGSWLWLSGSIDRGADWTAQRLYDLSADAGFAVQDVLVEGRDYTDADLLLALINIERGDPIFMFKPKTAKEMIERISWVREAHVQRRLPGTIYIGLTERQPLALWQHEKKVRVIDGEGITLTDRENGVKFARFRDLLIVVGEDAPDHVAALTAMLAAEPLIKERTEAAARAGGRRWDLTMKSGMIVKLPGSDMGLALRRLAAAHEQDGLLDKDLKEIDLREPGRIIVRTAPGMAQDYQASAKGNAI